MNGNSPHSLEANSLALVEALAQLQDRISWAYDVVNLFQVITNIHNRYRSAGPPPAKAVELSEKIKELEKYLSVDLQRHIGASDGRRPYYIDRLNTILTRALQLVNFCVDHNRAWNCPKPREKDLDHLTAELQTTFTEYGFCTMLEAIYNTDEANKRLDMVIGVKIAGIEKKVDKVEANVIIAEMHDTIALVNGIRQAMTAENIDKVQRKFDEVNKRLMRLENNITGSNISAGSPLFMGYMAMECALYKPAMQSIFHLDTLDTVNGHMIHPGTRGWILERISRWLHSGDKRMYFLSGKQGSGKTALVAAVCKLHNYDTVGCHFFDSNRRNKQSNTVNGLIQSLAFNLCQTMPEYLNHVDDKYGDVSSLASKLSGSWRNTYETLIKEPLQTLYGHGRSTSANMKRKLFIIDGLDECEESEWDDLRAFMDSFTKDLASAFCLFVTVRSRYFPSLVKFDEATMDGIKLEDRAWMNRHIKDIEIYIASSLGAILSGEDEGDRPNHAKADEMTLQNTVDELMKCSSGRFDYATDLMETFAREMSESGQFLSSMKRATQPVRQAHGEQFDQKMSDFASPYRSYRDREGRSVGVRVLCQSHYLMDKSRVALIRGRHQAKQSLH